jgi:hypothetical protein
MVMGRCMKYVLPLLAAYCVLGDESRSINNDERRSGQINILINVQ